MSPQDALRAVQNARAALDVSLQTIKVEKDVSLAMLTTDALTANRNASAQSAPITALSKADVRGMMIFFHFFSLSIIVFHCAESLVVCRRCAVRHSAANRIVATHSRRVTVRLDATADMVASESTGAIDQRAECCHCICIWQSLQCISVPRCRGRTSKSDGA
jgi:hypothetical protein